jgi:hypothetical protein
VFGADADGELKLNSRRLLGVDGGMIAVAGRVGETGRCGDEGVTSV